MTPATLLAFEMPLTCVATRGSMVLMSARNRTRACHTALYGNTGLKRAYCRECDREAFVLGGVLQCCESRLERPASGYHQESPPVGRRRIPPKDDQDAQLCAQDDRCFYCRNRFGELIQVYDRPVKLRPCWDHLVPYSYSQNNHTYNFVAACQLCNGIKAAKMFDTVEEAVEYVAAGWQRKGYESLSGVRD